MSVPTATSVREPLRFTGDVPVPERLAACKEWLRTEMTGLRARHEAGSSGLTICRERAGLIDALLTGLFDYAVAAYARRTGPASHSVALVALGGYGRGELSPWSDVDIMFLFPTKMKPAEAKPL